MKYICQFCGKECKTAQSLSYHQNRCKNNPNQKHNKAWNKDTWTCERLIKYNNEKFNGKFTFIFDKELYCRNDKIKFICPNDGEIEQTILQFINSPSGCIKCSKRTAGKNKPKEVLDKWRYSRLSNLNTWKEKCIEIHNNKYDYSLCTEYNGNRTLMKIICPIHGEFEQKAYKHIRGQGCPICGQELKQKNRHETLKQNYIKKLKKRLPEFDFSIFNYEEKLKTGKIQCICPIHGEITLNRQMKCPKCERENKDDNKIKKLINIIKNI